MKTIPVKILIASIFAVVLIVGSIILNIYKKQLSTSKSPIVAEQSPQNQQNSSDTSNLDTNIEKVTTQILPEDQNQTEFTEGLGFHFIPSRPRR